MKIILAGCTGFIGKSLIEKLLAQKHQLVLLTRNVQKAQALSKGAYTVFEWDAKSKGDWTSALEGADAVINLTGESIAEKRWSAPQKIKLVRSRVDSTKVLVETIGACKQKPKVFLNASAVGFYGNVDHIDVVESHPKGNGFLADLCSVWESQTRPLNLMGIRTVLLRIGIVLEKEGGALAKMVPPFLMFAGGPLGSGKQWFPWIHRNDVVGIILFVLNHQSISGPVNATAPNPQTMKDFSNALGKALKRPSVAPVPAFALKILLGEMSDMLLGGQKAVPQVLLNNGYRFEYETSEAALKAIFGK